MADGPGSRNRWTAARWIEVAALLPCTVFLAPLMFYGSIGLAFGIVGVWRTAGATGAGSMFALFVQIWVGIACLVAVWILLLGGVERVRRQTPLRRSVSLLLALGLADALHFLVAAGKAGPKMTSSTLSLVMWAAVLGLPMLLGARYLYKLLRT